SPRKALNFAMGGILGSLFAVATAFILETRDTSIKTVKEARELFGSTLLGTIPSFGKPEKVTPHSRDLDRAIPEVPVRDKPRSPISESYRMLQANLTFLSSDKELQVIVVTSSVPKEGKSTVSTNLAVATAQLERRVLLVDADMRRPSQHQIWELPNAVGLSNVIAGQAELKAALKPVMEYLDILTAGVLPPNPVALLNSNRMAKLIDDWAKYYDFVIIDTPPMAVAADALILGKMADGILTVVRPGVVDSASATSAKESLKQSGQNVLGQVVNGVIPDNEPDSYYYYYAKGYYAEEDSPNHEKLTSKTGKPAKRL
ncbi:MAG TPA: polysaccharide biosynthesis tyrosine autokinase, partial [Candidatus Caenarcaniphilales bacterium]